MHRRKFLQSAGVTALSPWLVAFAGNNRRSMNGATMGTFYKIDFSDTAAGVSLDNLNRDVRSALDGVENRLSLYRMGSELCRINSLKTLDWIPLTAGTARIIKAAIATAEYTDGAFDCSVGAASQHWGFGPSPVTDQELKARISSVMPSMQSGIELSKDNRFLRKKSIHAEVDLNAIAKGDAVDQLAKRLRHYGLSRYLIEIGGEFYGSGVPDNGVGWTIGISHPMGGVVDIVQLSGQAIATSGDYIHERQLQGRRLTHLIHPVSGEPIDSTLALVSVIANTTMQADAWATALQVMGLKHGLQFAKEQKMAALFLNRESGGYVGYATKTFDRFRVTTKGGERWLQG